MEPGKTNQQGKVRKAVKAKRGVGRAAHGCNQRTTTNRCNETAVGSTSRNQVGNVRGRRRTNQINTNAKINTGRWWVAGNAKPQATNKPQGTKRLVGEGTS